MKIDRSKLRKAQSELPPNCQELIQKLKEATDEETVEILKGIQTWHFGKCELFHWIDVLDKFDAMLANVSKHAEGSEWILVYDELHLKDKEQAKKYKELISNILKFTGLLVEHSYARHIYSSMEHLIALLTASDMEVVLCVLNVLYIFSKRSNFISRLPVEQRKTLHQRLYCLAENWGGDANGFGLAHCSKDLPVDQFPESASNVHFEFYSDAKKDDEKSKMPDLMSADSHSASLSVVHLEGVHKLSESPGEIMEKVLKKHKIPDDKKIKLFSRLRLARHFHTYSKRIKCLQARLQAISILVYSTSNQENTVNQLLYPGFVQEIVDAIRLNDTNSRYADISSASLRTLTAIIHLERNSRLNSIIEATGANSYHSFLPTLVRNCIQAMTDSKMASYSHGFATALFSFLYHLASYEAGGEALVSCGLMESLLKVIEWPGEEDSITFVTRAVRVVDLITNLDMAGFQNHGGLAIVLNRLESEIKLCQPYHGGILSSEAAVECPAESSESTESMETSPPPATASNVPRDSGQSSSDALMDTDGTTGGSGNTASETQPGTEMDVDDTKGTGEEKSSNSPDTTDFSKHSKSQIIPQRAALLKSILNFFKKAILDPSFSDSVRTVMDGSLPTSLKYIISNVEYYGPALYLLATDVVTVYVFHEPSLLSSLQDKDLTGVVLTSLVVKDIPATREVLAFLPNILSALCLNNRGLQAFMARKPFDKLFKVLLSPDYLPAMRRRRSSDALGDTAYSLGTAMDELMRHQPMLKPDAMKAIVKLLQEVCRIGSDPKVTCVKSTKNEPSLPGQSTVSEDEPVSDEEEYDEDRLPVAKVDTPGKVTEEQDIVSTAFHQFELLCKLRDKMQSQSESSADKKTYVPLTDYILNVVKFVDAILSNNSTDDHIREFVRHQGLEPLIKILSLPNLPLDFPSSPACQSIGIVSRSILFLCQEHRLLQQGLQQLTDTLKTLSPLNDCLTKTGQSVLLQEVLKSPKPFQAINSYHQTPLLHAMSATQSYVNMFTYICKSIQNDVRTICINHWGERIETLQSLCALYSSLVWESSVLLVLCTQENIPDECEALKKDLQRLSELMENDSESSTSETSRKLSESSRRSSDVSRRLSDDVRPLAEGFSTSSDKPGTCASEDVSAASDSQKTKPKASPKVRLLKHLLAASSRLGRSLAEFFSLLVRLAVGSGQRQRRPQHMVTPAMPTIPGKLIASQLAKLLTHGLSWKDPEECELPRINLTFYICSLGFVHPMLFDDRKNPYHLMLQQLVASDGLRVLYDRFQWVVSRKTTKPASPNPDEQSTLPEGSEEFVNAWLSLMDRLVNPTLIMESPHTLPAPTEGAASRNGFEPRKFLMNTQKHAFSAVNTLWEHKPLKSYGIIMKKSMLSVLCHIIHGEKLLKARDKSSGESSESSGPGQTSAAAGQQEVVEEDLRQLMDMGFPRDLARTALLSTHTIEQATEYALTRAPAPIQGSQQLGISLEMSEEDQMMQAIALSLGEHFPMVVDQPPAAAGSTEASKPEESTKSEQQKTAQVKDESQGDALESSVIDNFAANMLPGCVNLVSDFPETVYKACDLIVALSERNGCEWRDRVLGEILNTVCKTTAYLCQLYEEMDCKSEGVADQAAEYCKKPEASSLKSMLHLLSLVLEEMKSPCVLLIIESGTQWALAKLLRVVQKCLVDLKNIGANPTTPSWLTPLLILIDLYEKNVEAYHRKIAHDKCTGNAWKWFDDRSGRWHNYSVNNNNTIDSAYRKGDTSIRFTAGRRRYVVHFDTMIQVNEDSNNRRPIMLEITPPSPPPAASAAAGGVSEDQSKPQTVTEKTNSEPEKAKTTEQKKPETKAVISPEDGVKLVSLTNEAKEYLVRSCVSLISLPVENSALNAAVRLCVRLTRENHLAQVFVEAGGPHHILELKRSSKFNGFVMLLTLLLRHVLEDRDTLRHTMEKVIRSAVVSGIGNVNSGVGSNSLGTKEFNYVLRMLSPVAARQPDIFKELLLKSMRFSLPAQIKRGGQPGSEITIPPNQALFVNTIPVGKPPKIPKVSEHVRGLVYELLNALCRDPEDSKADESVATATEGLPCDSQSSGPSQTQVGRTLMELGDLLDGRPTPSLVRHLTGESLPSEDIEDMIIDTEASSSQNSLTGNKEKESETAGKNLENESKPLLTKKIVLGILSELVKSYSSVAQLIAEYEIQRPGKQSNPQMPVLAFVMDDLLPSDSAKTPTDHSHRARLLLTVIAACNHSPDAQAILVTELKESLARALALPECQQKHLRLQALFQLVLGIIDSGCNTQQPNSHANAMQQNGTIKLFVKKGVVSDLSRVPQSLDLSSPNVVATINGLLKPLEKLSNLVNLPTPANAGAPATEKKTESLDTTSRTSDVAEHILRVSGNRITREETETSHDETQEFSDLDSTGLHIEGRAVRRDPDQSYAIGSEGETDAPNETTISTAVSEQPEESERVPESDDDFSNPSLEALVIEIRREASHDSSVDPGGGGEEDSYDHSRIEVDNEDEDDEEDDEDPDEDEDDDDEHRSDGEEIEAEEDAVPNNEEGGDEGVVVESYNGVIMLEDEGDESEDHDDDDDDDEDDEDDDEDEEGSELEGHERSEFREHGGLSGAGAAGAMDNDYLFLHLDEPRQGSISRLMREHTHPGAIFTSTAFRSGLFAGLRSNPTSTTTNPSADLNVEHPLLRRQQSSERPHQTSSSRISRVHLLRSDRNRSGHMTHVHVHYSHPHDLPRFGRHLMDDDIRLITRAGQRRLGEEDFTDIFDFGDGSSSSNILSDISSPLNLWTQESQILDGGSVHHCAATVKKEVLPVLEKDLEEQVEVVRETEKKKRKEEEMKKSEETAKTEKDKEGNKEKEATSEPTTTPSTEPMQVEPAVSQASLPETVSGRDEEGHVYTEATDGAAPTSEGASSAPKTPTSQTAEETTPSEITPPSGRSSEMHIEAVHDNTPPSQAGDVEQPNVPPTSENLSGNSEMQVEASGVIVGDTPSSTLPHPPLVADLAAAPEAIFFVTPNFDIPNPVCPGAPTRPPTQVVETPDLTNPNLAPTPRSPEDDFMDTTGDGSSLTVLPNSTTTTAEPRQDTQPTDPTHAFTESLSLFTTEAPQPSDTQNPPAMIDGVQIPEGVDPSFLEALPEALRREVLAEQLAIRSTPATSSGPSTSAGGDNSDTLNVSPEFLAALPPEVQDEVLQQQRLEQERQRVRTMTPEEPVDPGTFLRNLPTALRQQILTDMDDSQLGVLPEDLSTQAQSLRREFEARQNRLYQDGAFPFADREAASAISELLRRSGYPRRVGRIGRGGSLQFSRLMPPDSGWGRGPGFPAAAGLGKDKKSAITGRQVLDSEALVCLLILLFVDEPRVNVNRLHKVIRNFCYHQETRQWVIQSLISILRRTSGQNSDGSCAQVVASNTRGKGPGKKADAKSRALDEQLGETSRTVHEVSSSGSTWLNMSVDAALGCRARIFNVPKTGKSSVDRSASHVTVNSQASSFVCKHVLDALAALAKNFPASFTPEPVASCRETGAKDEPAMSSVNEAEFWNILVRLDGTYGSKKGKVSAKNTSSSTAIKTTDFNASPIGYLMSLLSHPVIRRNANLMDSLLRLLSVISASLPDNASQAKALPSNEPTSTADVARPATPSNQSTASTGRAQTPESVTSSLVVETSPRGVEPETDSVDSGRTTESLHQESGNEPMDVEVHSVTSSVSDKTQSLDVTSGDEATSDTVVMAPQLKLAVEVLTSGACSEDGLEDATTLLLQVSKLNTDTRDAVLSLLFMGVRDLGIVLQGNISRLLEELRAYNATHGTVAPSEKTHKEPLEQVLAFQRLNRPVNTGNAAARLYGEPRFGFGTTARGRRRNQGHSQQRHIRSLTYDLHLPAMASFTEKTSSQNLFLRGLRVILQLRVAARKAAAAAKKELQKKKEQEAKEKAKTKATSAEESSEKAPESSSDDAGPSQVKDDQESNEELARLSSQLSLEELWDTLSECLSELARTSDRNAVLVLQPAVEAFFLVHGTEKENSQSNAAQQARGRPAEITRLASIRSIDDMPSSPGPTSPGGSLSPTLQASFLADLPVDQQVFLRFAEMHQTVLNHILRQSTTHLADGPFAVLVDHTRFLDFDVKRRYFRHELERLNEGAMRRDDLSIHVRRDHVFEDSYRELHRRSHEDMKSRLYVVFEGEEGQDAGGLLREWFMIMSREMFNPNYALFRVSPGDRVTYLPNPSSHCNSNHLSYFKFVGRVVAKAIYDNKLLDAYFTRSFYKHILGKPVKVSDMEAEDYSFYQGLVYLLEHDIDEIGVELSFSTDIEEFGVSEVRDLKANGRNIPVTEDNKKEYVKLICQQKMTGSIRKQIESFLEGFYEIIPKRLISIFDEQEVELLISGLPTIDLDDLKANTEYHKYTENSLQIQWLWRALRSFDQADRAKFLQFVTGTSKVPLQGFAVLEGMNGPQKFQIHRDDRSTDRLPAAHTCFNQLDLPAYETYDKLRSVLLKTIHECPEGFGLA